VEGRRRLHRPPDGLARRRRERPIAVPVGPPAEAFEGCRYAIETLKKMAPIWKEEFYETGKA
jgi:hypothetical protein